MPVAPEHVTEPVAIPAVLSTRPDRDLVVPVAPPIIQHIHPVQPVIVQHIVVEHDYKKDEGESGKVARLDEMLEQPVKTGMKVGIVPVDEVPISAPKQFPEQLGNNSSNNSDSELFEPDKLAPQATIAPYKKIGKVGRKRRYEEPGINGEIPVKKVVLYRHIRGKHWPGMSDDMREWYEHYYFTKPTRTERAKDAKDYERHVKSYERGRKWIAEHGSGAATTPLQGTGALGNSRKVLAYRKRADRSG